MNLLYRVKIFLTLGLPKGVLSNRPCPSVRGPSITGPSILGLSIRGPSIRGPSIRGLSLNISETVH